MTLLLSHGYFLADDPVEQKIMRPYPPLGLLSISAWLDREGLEHDVFDSTFADEAAFFEAVDARRPTVIAFYVTLMTRSVLLRIVRRLRETPRHAAVRIVLGGPDTRHNAGDYLAGGVDYLVVGEGEQTMADLARLLLGGGKPDAAALEAVAGLIFAGPDGAPVATPERQHLPDLDTLPRPARERIDLTPYLDAWREAHGTSSLNVSTQRGCPYSCNWCSRAVYGKSYRRRSPEGVVAELADLMGAYAPDQFWFVDDVFTINHRWMEGFAAALEGAGLTIRYECITRAERMTPRIVELLTRTGCSRVWIGAESGSQRILDAMDRRVDVGTVTEAMCAAREAGIATGTFLMLGYPGETEADIFDTLAYLKAARPDEYTITLAYPIRGTPLYDAVAERLERPAFGTGSDRDYRFDRTYGDRYYMHALRYLNHEVARGKASGVRAVRHRAAALHARLSMMRERLRPSDG